VISAHGCFSDGFALQIEWTMRAWGNTTLSLRSRFIRCHGIPPGSRPRRRGHFCHSLTAPVQTRYGIRRMAEIRENANKSWRVRQDLNLQPSDPKFSA